MYGYEFKELRLEQGITQKDQNYHAGKMIKSRLNLVRQ